MAESDVVVVVSRSSDSSAGTVEVALPGLGASEGLMVERSVRSDGRVVQPTTRKTHKIGIRTDGLSDLATRQPASID